MTNNKKEYFIYLQSIKQQISVTKEEFKNYYRDIDTYRKSKQRENKCICPPSKRLLCNMDCCTCPYQAESLISLDAPLSDGDGNEMNKLDYLQGKESTLQTKLLEDIVIDNVEIKTLFTRLKDLMPEAIEIGKLREEGLSEDAIEEKIGIGRKTYAYQIKKVAKILKKEFPEFF